MTLPVRGLESRPPNASWSLLLLPLVPLSAVYGVQYLDQILLGLFVQPIKADLALSDTQIGLLTGAAFTLLYTIMGLPLARVADRRSRKQLIIICTVVFSLATAASGLAIGFISLCVARMVVAVGEAGTMPAAISMLADVYRPDQRRLVMSLHSCGAYVATAVGLLVTSIFSNNLGWRAVFIMSGAAGLALAILFAWQVNEPHRDIKMTASKPIASDLREILRTPTFVFLALALGVGAISSSALINWFPAFLARSQHIAQPRIILHLAFAWGVSATSGGIFFGYVTTWLFTKGGRLPVLALAVLLLSFSLTACLTFLATNIFGTIVAFMATLFLMGGIRGPAFAVIQDIIPPSMRATASAVFMFSMYLIGVTLGPLLTGIISDLLGASQGPEALRHALLIVVSASGCLASGLAVVAAFNYPKSSVRPS